MKPTERQHALQILCKLIANATPLSHLFNTKPGPSPFTKELCFGVCRHYFRLEAIAQLFLKKKPKSLEVWVSLLLGLYQLHFLEIAEYAVVQESVALIGANNAPWAKGLVNAVLRRYCREKDTLLKKLCDSHAFLYGLSPWMLSTLQKQYPTQWQLICKNMDQHPPMSLRVNRQKQSRAEYLQQLGTQNIQAIPLRFSEVGVQLLHPIETRELPGFNEGSVSVQDEAAQLAVSLLDLKKNQRILDACSAPGGKTCHILESEPGLKECVALDIDPRRVTKIRENLERLQLNATTLVADALQPSSWWDGLSFDRILLDAPCSATGVIRRQPDIRLHRTANEINQISNIQKNLLQSLWPLLSTGGIFIYATCSILPRENEEQIAYFVQNHPDCVVITPKKPWAHSLKYGMQVLPGENNMDGFYYCVLAKK